MKCCFFRGQIERSSLLRIPSKVHITLCTLSFAKTRSTLTDRWGGGGGDPAPQPPPIPSSNLTAGRAHGHRCTSPIGCAFPPIRNDLAFHLYHKLFYSDISVGLRVLCTFTPALCYLFIDFDFFGCYLEFRQMFNVSILITGGGRRLPGMFCSIVVKNVFNRKTHGQQR